MSRRQWLQRSGAAAAGLALAGTASRSAAAAVPPPSTARPPFHPRDVQLARDPDTAIRLSSNENPLGPSEAARAVMSASYDEACRYPYRAYPDLINAIAEREGVSPDHVIIGAGSTEVLCMAGAAYGLDGGEVVAADPSYKGLTRYAETMGSYVHRVPLDDTMAHDLDRMDRRTTGAVKLVFVCNPNNPTGTIVPADRLRSFCEAVSRRAVVFVDEAYYELMDDAHRTSMVDLVRDGHNIIVARTFSKIYGMAGLRVGYGMARPDIVERLRPYSMGSPNVLGLRAAVASLGDDAFRTMSRQKMAEARTFTYDLLDDLGLDYAPSQASFVFFHTGRPIDAVRAAMAERGVLVGRPFPPFTDWCRVSMSTMDDMQAFATALRDVMSRPATAMGG
jgi:histidinol-phosphate aminotransferase